jgi:glutamyl-tRNA synthetase
MKEWMTILNATTFYAAELESKFKEFIASKNKGIGQVLPLFRLLVTGQGMGPSMFEIASFLGKEEVLERMENGLKQL